MVNQEGAFDVLSECPYAGFPDSGYPWLGPNRLVVRWSADTRVWSLKEGRLLATLPAGCRSPSSAAGLFAMLCDGDAHVVEESGHTTTIPVGAASYLAACRDGLVVASGSALTRYDIRSASPIQTRQLAAHVGGLFASADGSVIGVELGREVEIVDEGTLATRDKGAANRATRNGGLQDLFTSFDEERALSDERGSAVATWTCRAGLHCAPWAHGTLSTLPPGTVRMAPGWFTTEGEVELAIEAVRAIAS